MYELCFTAHIALCTCLPSFGVMNGRKPNLIRFVADSVALSIATLKFNSCNKVFYLLPHVSELKQACSWMIP